MQEWSPYAHIHLPHLDGYFRSTRGEFRLIELPNGRTRLEGSTWYELDLAPFSYWSLIADQIVHQIHLRVLWHVKAEAEKAYRGVLTPAKPGPIASAARRTGSRAGVGPQRTARHCTPREAHRAFGIGRTVRRKAPQGPAVSSCSSGSPPREGRIRRGTTNHGPVGLERGSELCGAAWLASLCCLCVARSVGLG